LLGFTDKFIVFHKGNYFATYDENFKKIKDIHGNIVGEFKNAVGTSINFVKGNYIVTFDVMFKKISERRV